MTAIADAELQELWDEITAYTPGSREAFCAALNERLEAAERLANAAEQVVALAPNDYLEPFIAAYRQSKEQP